MRMPPLSRRLASWLSGAKAFWDGSAGGRAQQAAPRKSERTRLALEVLEERTLLSLPPVVALDPSFGTGGMTTIGLNLGGNNNDVANAMAIESNGQIILVGSTQESATHSAFAIVRLNSNGVLDTTFNNNTGQQTISFGTGLDQGLGVALQANGAIVVVGSTDMGGGDLAYAVARLNANGTLDTTFNPGGATPGTEIISFGLAGLTGDAATSVAIQSNGAIVVAGSSDTGGPGGIDFSVLRLNTNGSLDTTFGVGGKQTVAFDLGNNNDDEANAVTIDSSGRILLTGFSQTSITDRNFAIARLTTAGVLDTTFGTGGKQNFNFGLGAAGFNDDESTSIALTSTGLIVVAGFAEASATEQDFAVARLNTAGALDTTFGSSGLAHVSYGSVEAGANAVYVQPDNRIVVGGFEPVTGTDEFAVTRLETNGTVDTTFGTFNVAFGGNNSFGLAMAEQSDGALVVAGFTNTGGANGTDMAVARTTIGSLDVDANGNANALTDGILILRFLFGFTGSVLTSGAVAPGATRTNPTDIFNYLNGLKSTMLDVDQNGSANALTDGILILRYLFGFTGSVLTSGAVAPGAPNSTAAGITTFLNEFNPNIAHQEAASAGPGVPASELLTNAELQATTAEAIALWEQAGITAAQKAKLLSAVVVLGNIGGTGLAETYGNVVLVDASAAGWGWYLDPSGSNAAFGDQVSPTQLVALPGSPAYGKMDLLTVVMHELGLVMGMTDQSPGAAPYSLMNEVLGTGVRRLP